MVTPKVHDTQPLAAEIVFDLVFQAAHDIRYGIRYEIRHEIPITMDTTGLKY